MTAPARADVVVAGLGPAGAATAMRLARAGFDVVGIDRARFPREKACSEYMSPETLRHLDLLGVLGPVEQAGGVVLRGARVVGPNGSELVGLFGRAGVAPFRPTGLSLPRRTLDLALVDAARAAGVRVVEGAKLVGLRRERGVTTGAILEHEGRTREVGSRLVVGADGLRSLAARCVGRRRFGRPARFAFVAHVADVAGMGETAEMHVGREGYVGLNAIGAGLTNVAVVVPARRAREAQGDPTGFWHAYLEAVPAIRGRVRRDRVVRPVLATGPFAVRSSGVVAHGALLVGDAAEFFDPFTGEGICAALRGAELGAATAAAALARPGVATADRLDGYRRARRRAFAGKWAVERLIGYGMLAPALFDRAVARLERRGLSHTLVGVTGSFVPPREVLRPRFLAAMML